MSYAEDQATILAREQIDEYAAMEADLDNMAAANASLLQELADAAARDAEYVAFGAWLRVQRAAALDQHRLGQARGMTRAIAFGDAISRYEQMEGSS